MKTKVDTVQRMKDLPQVLGIALLNVHVLTFVVHAKGHCAACPDMDQRQSCLLVRHSVACPCLENKGRFVFSYGTELFVHTITKRQSCLLLSYSVVCPYLD